MNLFMLTGLMVIIWAMLSVLAMTSGVYVFEKYTENKPLTRREQNGVTLAFMLTMSAISGLLYYGLATL